MYINFDIDPNSVSTSVASQTIPKLIHGPTYLSMRLHLMCM
jgi:hypothetical protein